MIVENALNELTRLVKNRRDQGGLCSAEEMAEINRLQNVIEQENALVKAEDVIARNAQKARDIAPVNLIQAGTDKEVALARNAAELSKVAFVNAMRRYGVNGNLPLYNGLQPSEIEVLKTFDQRRLQVLGADPKNADLTAGTAAQGGLLIPTTVAASILESYKVYAPILNYVNSYQTPTGNPESWPANSSSTVGVYLGENANAPEGDVSFTSIPVVVDWASSRYIQVSETLLQDAPVSLADFVQSEFASRLALVAAQAITTNAGGAGNPGPVGIVPKLGTTGNLTLAAPTFNDLIAMEMQVHPLARMSSVWLGSTDFVRNVRQLKDSQGLPIFLPGNVAQSAPQTLLGRPLVEHQFLAAWAANANVAIFGDFSKYRFREVPVVSLRVYQGTTEVETRLVRMLAYARNGGNLMAAVPTQSFVLGRVKAT